MNNDFNKNLSEFLRNEAAAPSKNIGEAAILKFTQKEEAEAKSRLSKQKPSVLRYAALITCIVAITIGGTIAASAEVRNSITQLIQNIFTLEKQGDTYAVVEKNAEAVLGGFNFGGISIDQFSESELMDKLGFKPFIPEVINSYSQGPATLGITLKGKVSDLITLRNDPDKLSQSIKDDSVLKSLEKYNPSRFLTLSYSPNGQITDLTQITLGMSKITDSKKSKTLVPISTFDYKGVKCSYFDDIRPGYQQTSIGNYIYDDNTREPEGIVHIKHISFDLDGVNYCISTYQNMNDAASYDGDNYDELVQFSKGYIDAYLSK